MKIIASWSDASGGSGIAYFIQDSAYRIVNCGQIVTIDLKDRESLDKRPVLRRFLERWLLASHGTLGDTQTTADASFAATHLPALRAFALHGIVRKDDASLSVHVTSTGGQEPFVSPPTSAQITEAVTANTAYRRVLFTAPDRSLQLVAMSVETAIPTEVHTDVHQYFLVKRGKARMIVNNAPADVLEFGGARWVMRGQQHTVLNDGSVPAKLFVTYSPAHHPEGRVDEFNADALELGQ